MCEKAIQRPLKNERQNVSVFYINSLQKATQFLLKQCCIVLLLQVLVERSLEDESDIALLAAQLLCAEGTGSMEGVCAMG